MKKREVKILANLQASEQGMKNIEAYQQRKRRMQEMIRTGVPTADIEKELDIKFVQPI